MLPPLPEFQRFQLEFTSHIRDPRAYPCPDGVESHRMEVYARLVYSNVESFLLPSFPVVRHVLGAHRWAELVRNFLATHRSASPFFRQIPDEFIQFLQTQDAIPQTYPPFLLELAHYEWVELVLSVSNRAGLGSNRARRQLIAKSPRSKSGARQPELSLAGTPYWTAG